MREDGGPATSLAEVGIEGARGLWNLSGPALYEEAVRRAEGVIALGGPLVCLTGPHTGRSPNDKFVVREAPSAGAHRLGNGQPGDEPGALRAAAPGSDRVPRRHRPVRAGLFRRRRCGLPASHPRGHAVRLAQSVRAQSLHSRMVRTPGPRIRPDASPSSTRRRSSRIPPATAPRRISPSCSASSGG